MSASKYLIVNADDYGRTPQVSCGIREAHLKGILTSTTAMMNMPGVEDALREAVDSCLNLGMGVHLTLTEGAPLLHALHVPSLVGADGQFLRLSDLQSRVAEFKPDELRAEWTAQIENFCKVVGRTPDHLDSHHHTSYLNSMLFATMLDLANEYHCAVRSPLPDAFAGAGPGDQGRQREWSNTVGQILAKREVPHPDHFITSFYDEGATLTMMTHVLRTLGEGITEIMCHPGYADAELLKSSSYNRQRERELQVLTDASVRSLIQELGIELATFDRLRKMFQETLPRQAAG